MLAVLLLALTPATAADVKTFTDCAGCPEMVIVPAGTFTMGSPPNDVTANADAGLRRANADEFPQHKVTIKSFALGKYEITQDQWFALMGEYPSFNRGRTLPVETISWDEAQIFVQRLSAKTGKHYRLPTEAEWEYAARAGTTTLFSFGDDLTQLGRHAWYRDNSGAKAHPVGEKLPNPFGLNDMHGNVWEWTQDCTMPNYEGAPTDGSAAPETPNCARVIRDGSGVDIPKSLRVAERYSNTADYRNGNLGLRVARDLN